MEKCGDNKKVLSTLSQVTEPTNAQEAAVGFAQVAFLSCTGRTTCLFFALQDQAFMNMSYLSMVMQGPLHHCPPACMWLGLGKHTGTLETVTCFSQ